MQSKSNFSNGNGEGCSLYYEREKIMEAVEQVDSIHKNMTSAENQIARELKLLRETLVGPATSKKDFVVVLALLAIIIGILIVKDSDKGLHIGADGINLNQQQQQQR